MIFENYCLKSKFTIMKNSNSFYHGKNRSYATPEEIIFDDFKRERIKRYVRHKAKNRNNKDN